MRGRAAPGPLKPCGGFHSDWCVGWSAGGGKYVCLVCFNCHEVKVFGPDGELYCGMRADARQQLMATLKKYRKNRPESGLTRE